MEIDNDDDSMKRVNLDDYDSADFKEYLFDDEIQTTTAEVTANFKSEPHRPPPSIKVTIKMEEEDNDHEQERRRTRNQKCAECRQRVHERVQKDTGESHDYSNNDLRNVINIG